MKTFLLVLVLVTAPANAFQFVSFVIGNGLVIQCDRVFAIPIGIQAIDDIPAGTVINIDGACARRV